MREKFSEWKFRLESLMREECGEVFAYDERVALSYYREGDPPSEFYREIISTDFSDTFGTDPGFDPRWEM